MSDIRILPSEDDFVLMPSDELDYLSDKNKQPMQTKETLNPCENCGKQYTQHSMIGNNCPSGDGCDWGKTTFKSSAIGIHKATEKESGQVFPGNHKCTKCYKVYVNKIPYTCDTCGHGHFVALDNNPFKPLSEKTEEKEPRIKDFIPATTCECESVCVYCEQQFKEKTGQRAIYHLGRNNRGYRTQD